MKSGLYGLVVGVGLTVMALEGAGQFAPHEMFRRAAYTNSVGRVIPYQLHAPQFPEKGKRYPVILFLHGSGECGTNNISQLRFGIPALMKQVVMYPEQVMVAAPQCRISNAWVRRLAFSPAYRAEKRPTLALRDALEICDDLIRNRQGDPDRLYITGLSLGGFGTWDAIQRDPGRFAAAAPLCAGGDVTAVRGLKNLPIWVVHGDADRNVPVVASRMMVNALKEAGSRRVRYQEIKGATHNIWDRTYGDPAFLRWMLSQSRRKPWWKFW